MRKVKIFSILLVLFFLSPSKIQASEKIIDLALAEKDSAIFSPFAISTDDYQIHVAGVDTSDIKLSFLKSSFEWVRVNELVYLPRASVLLSLSHAESGFVEYRGFKTPFAKKNLKLEAHFSMVLLSDSVESPHFFDIHWSTNGRSFKKRAFLKYSPKKSHFPKVSIDHSCSPYDLQTKWETKIPLSSWMVVSCQVIYGKGENIRIPTVEVHLVWDGFSTPMSMDGVLIESNETQYWKLRVRSKPGVIRFQRESNNVIFSYKLPENASLAFLGAGIGPYTYSFQSPNVHTNTYAPILTLYGGYTISNSLRFVFFDATSFHRNWYSDFGIYITSESIKTLDGKLSLNIMLGGHALVFKSANTLETPFGLPQGFELIYRDPFAARYNIGAGAFIYPSIGGKSYYNVWLRYGTSSLFAEINYLSWREDIAGSRFYSRAFGVSVGGPLVRFF